MGNKTKLPKRLAGMKVPRRLRKPAGKTLKAMRHPLVADLAAAALISAASTIASNERAKTAGRNARKKAGEAVNIAGAGAASLGTVIAAKARDGGKRISGFYHQLADGGSPSVAAAKTEGGRKSKTSK